MLTYLKKLQHKPEHVRKRIVLLTTVVLTTGIFLIWVSTLDSRNLAANENITKVDGDSPFTLFKERIAELSEDVSLQFEQIKESINGI